MTARLRPADSFSDDGPGSRFLEGRGLRGVGALGSGAATVGELLVEFPAGEQVLTTSAGSVAAVEFAAREQFAARSRGDQAAYDALDPSALLRCRVVSVLEGLGELVTDNGERFRIVTHGQLHPGDEGWVAVRAQWAQSTGVLYFVRGWSPGTRPLTVRTYDASLARSFARCLVMPELIAALDLRVADEASRALATDLLLELHGLRGPRLLLTEGAAEVTAQLCAALTADATAGPGSPLDLAAVWTDPEPRQPQPGFTLPPAPQQPKPEPEPLTELEDPTQRAVSHLSHLGFSAAAPRRWGADGATELVCAGVEAMVAGDDLVDQERALQALVGIASLSGKVAVFYSTEPYVLEALEWADRGSVACFELEPDGAVTPRSLAALERGRPAAGRHALPA